MTYKFLYDREHDPDQREKYYTLYLEYLRRVLSLDPIHSDARYLLDIHLGIVSVTVPFKEARAEELYRVGLNALRTGAPAGARELLVQALKIEEHPDIFKALGMAAYQQRDFPRAADCLADSIKLNPIQHDAYMVMGDMAEQEKRYAAAREFYLKALASYPHHYQAMQKIALISKRMDRPVRFLNIADPVPPEKRAIPPEDLIQVRQLAVDLKANIFEVQCWLVYHQSRRKAVEQYGRDLPGRPFPVTVDRESDDLRGMLAFYSGQTVAMGADLPHFNVLAGLEKKGLLKGAVFFYRWRDEFSEEFKTYRRDHFNDFYRMFDEHL